MASITVSKTVGGGSNPSARAMDTKRYECCSLEGILSLNISEELKEIITDKLGKQCCFELNGKRIGRLVGLEVDQGLSDLYYILESGKDKFYLSVQNPIQ